MVASLKNVAMKVAKTLLQTRRIDTRTLLLKVEKFATLLPTMRLSLVLIIHVYRSEMRAKWLITRL